MKKTEGQVLVCMSLVLAVRISRYFQSMVIVLSGLWGVLEIISDYLKAKAYMRYILEKLPVYHRSQQSLALTPLHNLESSLD